MPVQKESGLVRQTRELMEKNGWWVYKVHGNTWSRNGIPDLVCIKEGTTVWIELKMPGKKPSKIQEVEMQNMKFHGANVFVCDNAMNALDDSERMLQDERIFNER